MKFISPLAALLLTTLPLRAEQFFNEPVVIDGNLCVGGGCAAGQVFPVEPFLMRRSVMRMRFEDSSTNAGIPTDDWQFTFNDSGSSGIDHFSIENISQGTVPFSIEGDAPDASAYINSNGRLGIGTTLPARKLHIVSGTFPALRFEQDGSTGSSPYIWDIQGTGTYFSVIDITNGTVRPIKLYPGQAENTLVLNSDSVGIGTSTPTAKLMIRGEPTDDAAFVVQDSGFGAPTAFAHIRSRNGIAKLLVEEIDTTVSPRTLLELQNTGRPEIVMGNTDTGGEWSFGAGTNFILKQGAVGSASSAKTKLFEVQPTGDAVLTGALITGGPSCSGGCDAVFSDNYDLPSIAEHADAMFTLGHLPNVGPTVPGAPLNVTEQYGRLLNELEHAHIYIAQQNRTIAALAARVSALETD